MCLAFAFKPDGVNPSFMGPLLRTLDEDDAQKASGHMITANYLDLLFLLEFLFFCCQHCLNI